MHAYRVTGKGFQVGAGALIMLAAASAAERSHKVTMVKAGEAFSLVTAKEPQAFKLDEIVGLVDAPKGQLHLVELVGEHDASEPAASMRKAIAAHHHAIKAADRASELARVEAEKAKAAEAKAAAEAAAEKGWTEEWNAMSAAARAKHPKLADYIAFKKHEAAKGPVT